MNFLRILQIGNDSQTRFRSTFASVFEKQCRHFSGSHWRDILVKADERLSREYSDALSHIFLDRAVKGKSSEFSFQGQCEFLEENDAKV